MRRILVIATVLVFFHGQLFAYDAEVNGDVDSNGAYDIAFGGTNATTAAGVRTNLSLVSGINVQAYDADLTTYAGITPSANVQTFLGYADFAAMRTGLGLAIGTNVQAYSAYLDPTSSVQDQLDGKEAADADIAKTDVAETITEAWTFEEEVVLESGFSVDPSATPAQTFEDSDGAGTDKYAASIEVNMTTTTDGSEVSDVVHYYQDDGTKTEAFRVDGSDNQVEFAIATTLQAGDIVASELASTAVTPGSYTLSSITVDQQGRITAASSGSGAGGLSNVVEDTTPQLGGNLDIQTHSIEGVDATEFGYLDGVTSDIQTQFSGKQATLTNPIVRADLDTTPADDDTVPASSGALYDHVNASNPHSVVATEVDPTVDTSSEVVTIINTTPSTLIAAAAIHGDIARDTELTAGTADWATTGTITGKIETATDADAHTFTNDEYHGGFVVATGAGTYTLPTAVAGYSGCVAAGQGVTAVIGLLPATGDYLVEDGVRGTAATELESGGDAGDKICFVAANDTDWYVTVVGTWAE